MRHGWRSSWSGVRTPVRLSVQGPVGEASATAPFSIPLHHRYRRCDGWRVSSSWFFTLSYVTDQCQLYLRVQQKGIRHHTPAAARSTTGATLRLRNRISSSYSPSARLLRGIRTPVFSAAASCAAAGVLAAKPCFCTTIHRNEASKKKFKTRGWASGPLAPTTHYSHMH